MKIENFKLTNITIFQFSIFFNFQFSIFNS